MMKRRIFGAAMLAFSLAGTAQAIDTTWTGLGDGVLWSDPNNWSAGAPALSDRAFINGTGTNVTVDQFTFASPGRVLLADAAGTDDVTLTVDGGSIELFGDLERFELGTLGSGTLNISNFGFVSVPSRFSMGVDNGQPNARGIVNITSGGALAVGGDLIMGVGNATTLPQEINLIDGSLTASRLLVGDGNGATGNISMTGGTMTLDTLAIPTNYGEPNLTGHFQLDGGVVTVNAESTGGTQNQPQGFRLANGGVNNVMGSMDITAGTLVLMGDVTNLLNTFIIDGALTAYGGTGTVLFDYNTTNAGFTTVTAMMGGTGNPTDTIWTGGAGNSNWDNAGNWDEGIPTAALRAHINGAATVQIGPAVTATTARLFLAEAATTDNTTLNVAGGSLAVTASAELGVLGHGTLNVSSGSATIGGDLRIGAGAGAATARGTASVSGGTLGVAGTIVVGAGTGSTQTQSFTLSGTGEVTAGAVLVGGATSGTSQLVVNAGSLTTTGSLTSNGTTTINGGTVDVGFRAFVDGSLTINGGEMTVANRMLTATTAGSQSVITIAGGRLEVGERLILGVAADLEAQQVLNLSSGELVASALFLGDGPGADVLVNMTGGTMTLDTLAIPTNFGEPNLTGHFQLDGGVVTVNAESIGGTQNSPQGFRLATGLAELSSDPLAMNTGTMDITAGTLVLFGDATALVQEYVTNGWLTGYGDSANIVVDFDVTNTGYTTVTATGGLGPMPDLNMDGKVDIFDVAIVSNNWGNSGTPGSVAGDANKDGVVDIFDVALISNNWNPGGASAVPEPSTAVLLVGGVMGACLVVRRRRGAAAVRG